MQKSIQNSSKVQKYLRTVKFLEEKNQYVNPLNHNSDIKTYAFHTIGLTSKKQAFFSGSKYLGFATIGKNSVNFCRDNGDNSKTKFDTIEQVYRHLESLV